MKKLILILSLLTLVFISCKKEQPVANFTISKTFAYVDENIMFINKSLNANNYEWDFGDGQITTTKNATHFYTSNGVYIVKLTAISKNNIDVKTMPIMIENKPIPFSFTSLTSEKDTLIFGDTTRLTAITTGEELSYVWIAEQGDIIGNGDLVDYIPTATTIGNICITCKVSNENNFATKEIILYIVY